MQYNQIEIAKRIHTQRVALGWSQERLGGELRKDEKERNRNTVGSWENMIGKGRIPPLKDMLRMCELFNCELGYLLGEHDCKTRVATDVREEVGLSEKAFKVLEFYNKGAKRHPFLSMVEFLLEDETPLGMDWPTHNEAKEAHADQWEQENYIQVLSEIKRYFTFPRSSDGEHFIVDDGVFDSESHRDIRLHLRAKQSFNEMDYTEVMEEAILSDIRQKLKGFKEKIHRSPRHQNGLGIEPRKEPTRLELAQEIGDDWFNPGPLREEDEWILRKEEATILSRGGL